MVFSKLEDSVVDLHVIQWNVVNLQPVMLTDKKLPVFAIQDSLLIQIILVPVVWISMNVMLITGHQVFVDKVLFVRTFWAAIIVIVHLVLLVIHSVIVKI